MTMQQSLPFNADTQPTEDVSPSSDRRTYREELLLPLAKTFDELFEEVRPHEHLAIPPTGFWRCSVDARDRDPWIQVFEVRPVEAVAKILRRMYEVVDDPHIYVAIIVRDDGTALVTGKYDRIIGSRWIALVDPKDVPNDPTYAPGKRAPSAPPTASGSRKERVIELLRMLVVTNNVARFRGPQISDWHLLKEAVETLGGTWAGGRTQGFRFPKRLDAAAVIATAIETGTITNDAREADFIASPRPVAERLVALAELNPGARVLEPSAGQGAIADVIREVVPTVELTLVEKLDENREALVEKGYGLALREERDFLQVELAGFDAVVMNPPFQDEIAHVRHAFSMLRQGGRLASVMSQGIAFRQDRKTLAFREFVERHGTIENLPERSFRASGTDVQTVIVTLIKP